MEYYEADDWRCPDCGAHAVEQYAEGDYWIVACADCGLTISDSYIGN